MNPAIKNGKSVLLFSGGLDSVLSYFYTKPDYILYCKIGHRYEKHELAIIEKLCQVYPDFRERLVFDDRLFLGDIERSDAIIPLRNLFFISIASLYADTIFIGALSGEINGDKSVEFKNKLTNTLIKCYEKSYWSEGRDISVKYPVGSFTKAELVAHYLQNGGDIDLIKLTSSCYDPIDDMPCGICSACVKRYIALKINNISENTFYQVKDSRYLKEMSYRWDSFDEKRKSEIKKVFPEIL